DRFRRAHVSHRRTARRLLARLRRRPHPSLLRRRILARANGHAGRDFLDVPGGRDLLPGPRLSTPEVPPRLVRWRLAGDLLCQPDERSRRAHLSRRDLRPAGNFFSRSALALPALASLDEHLAFRSARRPMVRLGAAKLSRISLPLSDLA